MKNNLQAAIIVGNEYASYIQQAMLGARPRNGCAAEVHGLLAERTLKLQELGYVLDSKLQLIEISKEEIAKRQKHMKNINKRVKAASKRTPSIMIQSFLKNLAKKIKKS